MGYQKYRPQLQEMTRILEENNNIQPLKNFKEQGGSENSTYVIVIGESTNKARMSLYGHHRNTTPKLEQLRNELIIFENSITPRPTTIEALQQVLTFADQKSQTYTTNGRLLLA